MRINLRALPKADGARITDALEKVAAEITLRHAFVTGEEMQRLLAGEHPLTVWREKRGMTQAALASAAGLSSTYLSEIEARQQPGSVAALEVAIDDLVDTADDG